MGDHEHRSLRRTQGVDTVRDDAKSVDVEPGVGFVEHGQGWFEHGHLQDLVALLLTAGEPVVHRTVLEGAIHVHRLHCGFGQGKKIDDADRFEAPQAT